MILQNLKFKIFDYDIFCFGLRGRFTHSLWRAIFAVAYSNYLDQ